jgi:hypothetical protein
MHHCARVFVHKFCTRSQRTPGLPIPGLYQIGRTQCPSLGQRELYTHPITVEDGTLCALPFRAKPALECAALAPLSPLSQEANQMLPCGNAPALPVTGPSWPFCPLTVYQARLSFRSGGKSSRKNGKIAQHYRLSCSWRGTHER